MILIEKLIFACFISFIGHLNVINCGACEQNSTSYCSLLKRVDISKLELDNSLRINLSNGKYAKFEYEKLANATIKNEIVYVREIHSRKEVPANLDSLAASFEFKYSKSVEDELQLSLTFKFLSKDEIITKLKDKTFKLKLTSYLNENENVNVEDQSTNLTCILVLDFYDQEDIEKINLFRGLKSNVQLTNIDHQQLSFVYYEATFKHNKFFIINEPETTNVAKSAHQIELDLKSVINKWCNESYSILCLKCNSNFTLIMANDVLKIKGVYSNQAASMKFNDIFEDIIIIITQENQHLSYLNVRIYFFDQAFEEKIVELESVHISENLNSQEEEISLAREKRYLSKKYQSNNSSSALSGSKIHHLNSNYNGYNLLKPAQLVITEETIGLQTKLKIYEHIWIDYQLNASDYVKQRIQLIAPDNPILNITRPFDYELGGPMHTFQIIFTRKSDKRSSEALFKKINK
jgi:hypothetical protein